MMYDVRSPHRNRPIRRRRSAIAVPWLLAASITMSAFGVPMLADAQQISSIRPIGPIGNVMRILVEGTAESGREYELQGNVPAALQEYEQAAYQASQQVSASQPIQQRLAFEVIVASTSLDAARLLLRFRDVPPDLVLQYLAAAEGWQEAAMRDVRSLQAQRLAVASSLVQLAYTTQGYLDVVEGRQAAATVALGEAPQIEPARNLLGVVRGLARSHVAIDARGLYAAWQRRPRPLDPKLVTFLQGTVALVTKTFNNRYVSVIGLIATPLIGAFERP